MGHAEQPIDIAYSGSPDETAQYLRGYGEALAGEPASEPEEDQLRTAYRKGWKRGDRERNPNRYEAGAYRRTEDGGVERAY